MRRKFIQTGNPCFTEIQSKLIVTTLLGNPKEPANLG